MIEESYFDILFEVNNEDIELLEICGAI